MSEKRKRVNSGPNGAAARIAAEVAEVAEASQLALAADLKIKIEAHPSISTSLEAVKADISVQEEKNKTPYKGVIYFGGSFAPITIAHEGAIRSLAESYPEYAILIVPASNLYGKASIDCANGYTINGDDFRLALVKKAIENARTAGHTNVFFSPHEMGIPGGLLTGVSALSIKNILGKNVIIVYGKDNVVGLLERRFAHPRAIVDLIRDGEFEFRYFERGGPLTEAQIKMALQTPVDYGKSVYPNKLRYEEGGHYREPYTDRECDFIIPKILSLGALKDGDAASEVGSVPVSSSALRQAIFYASSKEPDLPTLTQILTTVLKGKIITDSVFDLLLRYQPVGPFPYASGCPDSKGVLTDSTPDATVKALVDAASPKVMVANEGGGRRRYRKSKKAKKAKKSRKTKKSSR
jgi:nicotinic acid mononucleotide adenylyltransferase